MSLEELRFEILKLTYAHAREATEAVVRAKVLEAYIFEPASPVVKVAKKPKAEKSPG